MFFNSNIIKKVNILSNDTYANQEVSYVTIGKKANDAYKKSNKVITNNSAVYDDLTFENVAEIAESLMDLFLTQKVDKIVLVYNKFKNAATQEIMNEQFLPIVPIESDEPVNLDYIYEPSKAEIVVVCSSDDEYATLGPEIASKLKKANKELSLVVAGYPKEILDSLKQAGVDEFIHVRSNLLQTLESFQEKLGIF